MTGLVLLMVIGVLVAWVVTRGRRKLKLPVTGKHWAWIIVVVVVVLAIAYGASGHVSPH